ncbi:MAG: carbon-nitrogen hydrolase family protein [Epsilonproteobacteria bacterium]|nr:carbon-nitrogen hydrolase family protein [Campylobacterota bacterium]NPA63511.1 carbon-nitrogen hydrolase family protein [Campylobacterota bacterium]
MIVAALQSASFGLSPNRLDYYLKVARSKEARLFLLPEYVLNRFFHEIKEAPIDMVAQQSATQIGYLRDLAKKYDMVIVAPVVRKVRQGLAKSIAIVRPEKISYYEQQILINYPHWNEESFFANEIKEIENPPVFKVDDVRFGLLGGFEIHFDLFWQSFMRRDVECVLVPSVSTFGSGDRWLEVLKTRAFVNNLYVLRANRVGEYEDKNALKWKFYGRSCSILPNGRVSVELGQSEELLIDQVDKDEVKRCRRDWGFKSALKKRGAI